MRPERLLLAACALLFWLPAAAADLPPQEFRAVYATALNGMPLGFPLVLQMDNPAPGEWNLALSAKSSMLDYREESRFRWSDCRPVPLRYRYEFSGFAISRKLWLDFDHTRRRATGESRKGPLDYEFPADATDELSLSFAARCQYAAGFSQTQFNVATINGMRRFTYRLAGTESLKLPWGQVDALRVERVRKTGDKRRSTLWVAPTLNMLMVKMEHTEKVGVRGTVALKELQIAGRAVTPQALPAPVVPAVTVPPRP